jgi:hypothetical protein
MAKRKVNGNGSGDAEPSDRIVKLELLCELTPEEHTKESEQLAKEDIEILRLQEEARAKAAGYRESIKMLKEVRDPRAVVVESHKQKRLVECVEEAVFERGVVVVKRRDTGEHVSERPLENDERERMAQGQMPWGVIAELPEKAANDIEQPRVGA